jgi:hypothetical protein
MQRAGGIGLLIGVSLGAAIFLSRARAHVPPPSSPPAAAPQGTLAVRPPAADAVWLVESRGGMEVYSNGLRIDARLAVANHARAYVAFPISGGAPVRRAQPAGIVFHSTESRIAPFEAGHNEMLKRIGESLLDYVRRRRAYHYVIDRFGRVYRTVAESDAADHAGYSVWADDGFVYVNLNESFLGLALEAATDGGEPSMTSAQTRSTLMLVEMLRARYRITAGNCVTHAQVSVNPSNLRAGYHVDWAAGFPFSEIGLPDNYGVPLPSVWVFGFRCDPPLLATGAEAAERILAERAERLSLSPAAYRKRLQQQYRQNLALARRPDT